MVHAHGTTAPRIRLKDFVVVAKPGIVVGNVCATIGGFLLASKNGVNITALVGVAIGTLLVIAASCVVNNYLDRTIDRKMSRTRQRPSATGTLPFRVAMLYAAALYVVGFTLLLWLTNVPTAAIGFLGALFYTLVYGYAKRHTHHGTLIGSLPGATPPLAGYVAASGVLDQGAWLVFAAMVAWQMPHFYAIGIRRLEDYKAAGVPILPAVKSLGRTVWEMRIYGIGFVIICYLLAHWGYAGFMFGFGTITLGLYWLQAMFSPNWRTDTEKTAKTVFVRSLHVLLGFCFFMAMSHVLL